MTNGTHECWMTGFTPTGRKVSFTLSSNDPAALVRLALQFDAELTAAGISVREPGLEEGEQSETFHYIVRRAKGNDDGSETPIIDLYVDHEKMHFSLLKVYLNTSDDVAAFQQATGLQLAALPLYDGQAAIERGKDTRIDSKYMVRLQRPVQVVWKSNPAYEENGKKAKRLFVRWGMPVTQDAPPADEPPPQQPARPRGKSPYANADTSKPKYNPELLRSVLEQAGYTQDRQAYFLENIEPGKTLTKFSDSTLSEADLHKRILDIGKALNTAF